MAWQRFLLESTGLRSSRSLSFLSIGSITTQLATPARGQERVTDPNSQLAPGLALNRPGNCLVKAPAPWPAPAPPDAGDVQGRERSAPGTPVTEQHRRQRGPHAGQAPLGHPRAATKGGVGGDQVPDNAPTLH